MPRAIFITTWPTTIGAGSGTAMFITSLRKAVEAAGTEVTLVNPPMDTTDYTKFTLDRFWANIQFAADPQFAEADWILGLDYDGFAIPRREGQPFIGTARTVFADLAPTEPDPFHTMLVSQAYFEQKNLSQCDFVVVPSHYSKGKVIEHYGIPADDIHVVYNGITLDEWDGYLNQNPEPDPNRRPTVLAVSKLFPRKKIDLLIRAVPTIRDRFPDVEVRVAGAGFQWDEMLALRDELGVADNLTMLGDVTDRAAVAGEYKRCHVFCHPSIQESFGNVLLEGMGASKPLVVSDAGPMPELVEAAGAGLVVPPDDAEALADAICTLLDNTALREQYAAGGRAFASNLTWEKTAHNFMALMGQ